MGLAASQARLLTITSRLHDIELKQQTVANQKMRLANESDEVYNAYAKALNTQRFTWNSKPLVLNDLYKPGSGYRLMTKNGKMVLPKDIKDGYTKAINGWNQTTYMDCHHNYNNSEAIFCLKALGLPGSWSSNPGISSMEDLENKYGKDTIDYYRQMFKEFMDRSADAADGNKIEFGYQTVSNSLLNDPNWLYNAVESGEFILVNTSGTQVTPTGADFGTEYDKSAIAQAEAKYNAETNKLNRKEKQLDNDARKLDTEYSAMNTELESTKSIIKNNSDKTFNLFG